MIDLVLPAAYGKFKRSKEPDHVSNFYATDYQSHENGSGSEVAQIAGAHYTDASVFTKTIRSFGESFWCRNGWSGMVQSGTGGEKDIDRGGQF